MARENFNDLQAFVIVAREGSFTRAAAILGVSQSALSHTIRALETRLSLRLLTRTTRSVAVTDAGDRLLQTLAPRFEEIEAEIAALSILREKPAGTIRITTGEHAAHHVLWPKLVTFLAHYPDINVELNIDNQLTDIVAERFDAGVRFGDQVAKDMVAARIGPDMQFALVGTASYFAQHPIPKTPQDLADHNCINIRLPTYGGLYAWEFEKDGHPLKVRVAGQLIFNSVSMIHSAVLAGMGLAYLPEEMVAEQIQSGHLQKVMEDWYPTFPGYHLYYPSRRLSSPAFNLFVEAMRYQG